MQLEKIGGFDYMKKNIEISFNVFDEIKHIDEEGREFWYARELQSILGYYQWRSINSLIKRAKVACKESNINVDDHFAVQRKMINLAKGAKRNIIDYKLSRYACYLIVMNGNPNKEVIALAQTYFAVQTRKQEILEMDYDKLSEDEKRFYNRKLTKKFNSDLIKNARSRGVVNIDNFQNFGYRGLYNGESAADIAKRKGLNYREEILDNMGPEELAANLFRITQTDAVLNKNNIKGEKASCDTHYSVGVEVRNTIKKIGGTMPEDLPTPKKSLKQLNKEKAFDKYE
jgi:DNA-damage-inducible protein D